jgi:hypothetical protein
MSMRGRNNGWNNHLLKTEARRRLMRARRRPDRLTMAMGKFWILGTTTADTIRRKAP